MSIRTSVAFNELSNYRVPVSRMGTNKLSSIICNNVDDLTGTLRRLGELIDLLIAFTSLTFKGDQYGLF